MSELEKSDCRLPPEVVAYVQPYLDRNRFHAFGESINGMTRQELLVTLAHFMLHPNGNSPFTDKPGRSLLEATEGMSELERIHYLKSYPLRECVRILEEAGWSRLEFAAWLIGPSSFLGGRRPCDVLDDDPDLTIAAARDHIVGVQQG